MPIHKPREIEEQVNGQTEGETSTEDTSRRLSASLSPAPHGSLVLRYRPTNYSNKTPPSTPGRLQRRRPTRVLHPSCGPSMVTDLECTRLRNKRTATSRLGAATTIPSESGMGVATVGVPVTLTVAVDASASASSTAWPSLVSSQVLRFFRKGASAVASSDRQKHTH